MLKIYILWTWNTFILLYFIQETISSRVKFHGTCTSQWFVLFFFFLWTEEKLNKGEFVIHFLFMFFVGNECDKQVSDSCSATFSSFTEAIFVKWSIQDGKQKDDKLSPVVVIVISLLSVLNFFFLGCICIVYVVAMNRNF